MALPQKENGGTSRALTGRRLRHLGLSLSVMSRKAKKFRQQRKSMGLETGGRTRDGVGAYRFVITCIHAAGAPLAARARQQASHDARQLVAVEAKLVRCGPTELMHPVSGRGRLIAPPHLSTKDEVNVPGWHALGKMEDRPVQLGEMRVGVVVMYGAGARDAPTFSPRRRLPPARRKNRKPDDVSAEVRIRDPFEHPLFDYGGPP